MPDALIRISPEQLRAMTMADPERLVEGVAQTLREDYPELVENIEPLDLRGMIDNALSRARRWGLQEPSDLCAFTLVSFVLAPNFDEQSAIRQALSKARSQAPPIFPAVLDGVPSQAFEEAEANYTPEAWFSELRTSGG